MIIHEPIYIKSNDVFTDIVRTEGWAGRGTKDNPYIIENLIINGSGFTYCIWIENTDVYFVIRNCKLFGAMDNKEPWGCSIYLKNVKNGIILNNTCTENEDDGIYLYQSSNNILSNNTCTYNANHNIALLHASNNIITRNNCIGSKKCGIFISGSDNNILTNNTCVVNGRDGIHIVGSSNNVITHNTCTKNNSEGIYSCSVNNVFAYNTCTSNIFEGINVSDSTKISLSNNICRGNNDCDIYLYKSSRHIKTTIILINNIYSSLYTNISNRIRRRSKMIEVYIN